jgi:hypothetical protein
MYTRLTGIAWKSFRNLREISQTKIKVAKWLCWSKTLGRDNMSDLTKPKYLTAPKLVSFSKNLV